MEYRGIQRYPGLRGPYNAHTSKFDVPAMKRSVDVDAKKADGDESTTTLRKGILRECGNFQTSYGDSSSNDSTTFPPEL